MSPLPPFPPALSQVLLSFTIILSPEMPAAPQSNPPSAAHVPLGILVVYEDMSWTPELAPVSAPAQELAPVLAPIPESCPERAKVSLFGPGRAWFCPALHRLLILPRLRWSRPALHRLPSHLCLCLSQPARSSRAPSSARSSRAHSRAPPHNS